MLSQNKPVLSLRASTSNITHSPPAGPRQSGPPRAGCTPHPGCACTRTPHRTRQHHGSRTGAQDHSSSTTTHRSSAPSQLPHITGNLASPSCETSTHGQVHPVKSNTTLDNQGVGPTQGPPHNTRGPSTRGPAHTQGAHQPGKGYRAWAPNGQEEQSPTHATTGAHAYPYPATYAAGQSYHPTNGESSTVSPAPWPVH